MIESQYLFYILLCLVFSAFFSGMEIAYVSADKLGIELKAKQGSIIGRILAVFQNHKSRFLATTLVGNNIALVLYGIYMAQFVEPWLSAVLPEVVNTDIIILIIQTLIATIIVLLTAEFIPKSLFLLNPDFMLSIFALPMAIIYYGMFPVVSLVEGLSKLIIVHILKFDYSDDKPVYGLTDLNNYVKKFFHRSEEEEQEIDVKIFNNALEFKDTKVRECMIPRTEIVAVDIKDEIDTLVKAFIDSGHSKIIVYKESIDEVIGYCHSLEMFRKPDSIKKILTPIIIVTETTLAKELLIQFINERKSLALVVDEFGGTSGIVSMEDVIEEIFGEIHDEHDEGENLIEEMLSQNEYLLSARHEIDYLNEKFQLEIPEGEYDTLGGFILSIYEDFPEQGELIYWNHFIFHVISMEDNRIDKVKLTISASEDAL